MSTITSTSSDDLLNGTPGADTFEFAANSNGVDTITDFGSGDKITVAGAVFTGSVTQGDGSTLGLNQVNVQTANGVTTLTIGTDATTGADITILLQGSYAPNRFTLSGNQILYHDFVAPTLSGLPASPQSVNTGVAAALADFIVADADSPTLSVTLTASNGVINGLVDEDQNTAGIQVTGSAASINAALAGATFTATTAGAASIGVTVSDGSLGTSGTYAMTATTLANHAPYGYIGLTGAAGVGQVLTANTAGLADPDGIAPNTFTYQWLQDGVAIQGATGASYTVLNGNSGHGLSVQVSYLDNTGHSEAMTSYAMTAYGGTTVTPGTPAVNNNPYGGVGLSGNALVGQWLTANTGWLGDADGIGPNAFTYQWLRDGVAISGATASTYLVDNGDSGHGLSVQVRYTDLGSLHTVETVVSSSLVAYGGVPVAPAGNHSPYGGVGLSGAAQVGQSLSANTTWLVDPDGMPNPFSYQWLRDGVAISGATSSSYTVANGDSGHGLSVQVSYTDGGNFHEVVSSTAMTAYGGTTTTPGTPPVNHSPYGGIGLSGNAQVGQSLTANTSWLVDPDGIPANAFSYQWLRGGVAISGATSSSYTILNGDSGQDLSVRVTYTDSANFNESVVSATMTAYGGTTVTPGAPAVNHSPYGGVGLSGNAQVGQSLTANTSWLVDPDGIPANAFHYQWLRDGAVISGATSSSYLIVNGDSGHGLSVQVSYTDSASFNEVVASSAMTAYGGTTVALGGPAGNQNPYGGVSLSGIAQVGQSLTANTSYLVDPDGIPANAFHYQWLRDGNVIAGATLDHLQVSQVDAGHSLSVQVSYIDNGSHAEMVTSYSMSAYELWA